jgi:hypothetical protein
LAPLALATRQDLTGRCQFVVDTGTSIITGPSDKINPMIEKIGNVSSGITLTLTYYSDINALH